MLGGTTFEHHLAAPRGIGALARSPNAGVSGGAACGDLIRFSIRVERETVAEAGFDASGCGAMTAAGSMLVEMVEGRHVLDAARIGPRELSAELGGLLPSKFHAADLAADALHRALGTAARDGALALSRPADGRPRTLVAMSGGVDSSVAARLALESGDEVVGVTLELWGDPENDGARSCCSAQAVTGARALAQRMGLPHITLDLREPFRAAVVDDFLAGHSEGSTPNPCVRCNGLVRFDAMLRLADRLGAATLVTGHYARIGGSPESPLLRRAADDQKDQTYMLARLVPEDLRRLRFPLGELTKPEVRALARKAELPVAEKPESQDLCFLAGVGRERFLRRHGPRGPGRGQIVAATGEVLGGHDGHDGFTVGQRRGLGLASPEPLYVLRTDARSNRVVVGPRSALATTRVQLRPAVLHRSGGEVDRVKVRYRQPPVPCSLDGEPGEGEHERLALTLARPVEGAAPGQLACLMRGELVLGWGTIAAGEEKSRAA